VTPLLWLALLPARAWTASWLAVSFAAYVAADRTGLLAVPTCPACQLAGDRHDDTCTVPATEGDLSA
jgi:hypothetical protein